jgi:hypothetical protein
MIYTQRGVLRYQLAKTKEENLFLYRIAIEVLTRPHLH